MFRSSKKAQNLQKAWHRLLLLKKISEEKVFRSSKKSTKSVENSTVARSRGNILTAKKGFQGGNQNDKASSSSEQFSLKRFHLLVETFVVGRQQGNPNIINVLTANFLVEINLIKNQPIFSSNKHCFRCYKHNFQAKHC